MSKKQEILGHLRSYSIASQSTHAISLITGVMSRNLLGPLSMGIWATFQIILEYSKYSTLGTTKATAREIPFYLGKNEVQVASDIKDNVASFAMATSVLTSCLLLVVSFWIKDSVDPVIFYGLNMVALIIILQRVNNLMIALLRAYKKFKIESKLMILSALVNLGLIWIFTARYQFQGLTLNTQGR